MKQYESALRKMLVNHKIVDFQFIGGYPVIVLDKNVCVTIQRDDEGNGPGAMFFQSYDGKPIEVVSNA